mgnify:CR=1 FL=1
MNASPWTKERRTIICCKDCKPPKRYPGCGDHCKEYKKEKIKLRIQRQREKQYNSTHPVLNAYDFNKIRTNKIR